MRRLRVLVVDDNATVAAFAARWLCARGCEVVRAAHGRGALEAAGGARFDAVLLDVDLGAAPDGVELAGRLRVLAPGLRLVLMSGDPANEGRVRDAGLGSLLLKPFTPAEMEKALGL